MKQLATMYPGKAYSPETTLAEPISATETKIMLVDASVLPDAPNIAVISDGEYAETVLYTEKRGNTLAGVVRGIADGDETRVWNTGAVVARNMTSQDLNTVQENIQALYRKLVECAQSGGDETSPYKPGFYVGIDLTERFADEIDGDPWAWIQARIRAGDYRGINVGDFIPFQIGNATVLAEVAGINTYTGTSDERIPNHIDFISRDLFNQLTQWNFATFSNGTVNNPSPWLNSNIYAFLNGLAMDVPETTGLNPGMRAVDYSTTGLFPRLPEQLRAVIAQKRVMLPTRFLATALQQNDNGSAWMDIGNLWLPAEVEVTGVAQLSGSMAPTNHFHSVRGFVQYPIFANDMNKRIKGMGHGGNPGNWFTMSNQGGNTSTLININTQGVVNNTQPTSSMRPPVCFRIS